MRELLKSLLASASAAWHAAATPARRERLVKFAILAAIAIAAGPEIFAALELQILLELLGASLFTVAFIAGAKLAALRSMEILRDHALPAAPFAFMTIAYADAWLGSIAAGSASVHAIWKSVQWIAA